MKRFSRRALLGLVLWGALFLARAEDKTPLPPAADILERFAREIGGKTAFRKHSSQHIVGAVEMPAQKINGKMEVFAARPNKLIMKVSMPGLGDVTTGFTGEVAWMSTAITGPMLIEGKMMEEVSTQADFDHSLHDPADYKVMEVLGKEDFTGEECYKLKLVHRSGFESTEYFSVKSGLQRGFSATQQTQFGAVATTTIVSDYRKFGDLLMPARTIQKASGIETIMTIDRMDYDAVPVDVFNLPPEIKTLLEQKKKAPQKPVPEKKDA